MPPDYDRFEFVFIKKYFYENGFGTFYNTPHT